MPDIEEVVVAEEQRRKLFAIYSFKFVCHV